MWRDRLHRLLVKGRLKGTDLAVFLFSLLLAFGIWLLHNLSLNYSDTMSVPVVAECNLEGHANVSSNSSVVVARCRTTGFSLLRNARQRKRDAVRIRFQCKDMHQKEGEIFSIGAAELGSYVGEIFGDGVRLESILSENVQFRFPFENHRRVPVQAMHVMSFKPQYMAMGEMRLQPDSVTVYGEPFHLEHIDRVSTRTINLPNLHSSAHGVVKLEPIAGVRLSETEVNYSLDVTRFVEISAEAVVSLRNVPSGVRLSVYPSTAKVVYRCAFPLSRDPTDDVRFYIDYKDFANSRDGKCVPRVSGIPEGVISYAISPEVFECIESSR